MARICSAQRLLKYRCAYFSARLRLLTGAVGDIPLSYSLKSILQVMSKMATNQLLLTSRTIHTSHSPYFSTTDFMPNFSRLASALAGEVYDATQVLTAAMKNPQLLENLEIMALSLRREAAQLQKIFFNREFDVISEPSQLIRDTQGRLFWEREFGQSNCVIYSVFKERLLRHWEEQIRDRDEERAIIMALNFFLDFPQEGMVTTYKWDVFLVQWGIFSNLLDNLRLVALQPGFLGVMNGKQAEQVLSSLRGDYALIRFSSSSKTLSVAYTTRSRVVHERKPPGVDLGQWLREVFKRHRLVPMSLLWDKLDELRRLEDYVKIPATSFITRLRHDHERLCY
eukprot:TRINITY_DN8244_c0_g1_i1.p1 TRINITY_DN8244_c0_g1~~TRINITY_DN8244_c0_g1_i1.p1  ORF type:complete len:391 (+),score=23.61 TRINITY_DN8244_c0_g1_i1:154-1173(+)